MSRAERIFNLLKEFNGKQVGGKKSTRVEVDLGLLLQYMEYEDHIKELEKSYVSMESKLDRIEVLLSNIEDAVDDAEDIIDEIE